jgi:hypothetical protein
MVNNHLRNQLNLRQRMTTVKSITNNCDLTPDQLVTALNNLDVPFLTGGEPLSVSLMPTGLFSALISQPEARLRLAIIPLLLKQPDFAIVVPDIITHLPQFEALQLKLYYTAAMLLQQKYQSRFRILFGKQPSLVDYFSIELGLTNKGSPQQRLRALGKRHQHLTGKYINWYGTYNHAAERFLNRKEWQQIIIRKC